MELAERRVDRLSTGERGRALVGRLLAAEPKLLLLDEPLSNLDPYWVRQLTVTIRQSIEEQRSAALVSLHDLDSAGVIRPGNRGGRWPCRLRRIA